MNCSKRAFLAGIDGVSMWSAIVSGGPSPRTVSKRVFVRHFRLKTITLPRQARDKHGESSKQRRVFLQEIAHTITNSWNVVNGVKPCNACVGSEKPGTETRLFAPFLYKMIILPRQARDKHRENSKKDAFLQAKPAQTPRRPSPSRQGALVGWSTAAAAERCRSATSSYWWATLETRRCERKRFLDSCLLCV